jgi:hypothetical protein
VETHLTISPARASFYPDPISREEGGERGGYSPISACRTFFMRMTLTVNQWHGDSPSCGLRGHWTHSSSITARPVTLRRLPTMCLPPHFYYSNLHAVLPLSAWVAVFPPAWKVLEAPKRLGSCLVFHLCKLVLVACLYIEGAQ